MKCILVLCFLSLVTLSITDTNSRGCIYINGRCFEDCPEGTHVYITGCKGMLPEPTCDQPHPVEDALHFICDYSFCYCDPGTVRDTKTKQCVPLDQCTKRTPEETEKND